MTIQRQIRPARAYEDTTPDDGQRVLVDRIWPRGIRKDYPCVGIWCNGVAPSKQLREWYHHQPERFDEFAARYAAELAGRPALDELHQLTQRGVVALVTATREVEGSHVAALGKLLRTC